MLAATAGSAPLTWAYATGNYAWTTAVSHDGQYAIAGSDDTHTYFFHVNGQGKPVWIQSARGYVRHVAISSNGTCAAAGDFGGGIYFFHSGVLGNGAPMWSLQVNSSIYSLSMSDDCTFMAAGDREGRIFLFVTGRTTPAVQRHSISGAVIGLALSESGAFAATSAAGGLYFFGEQGSSPNVEAWVFQNYTSFPQVAIGDDAGYVVAGGSDGYVYLLNRSGQLLSRERLGGSISALSISRATGRLVAASTNGNVTLFAIQGGLRVIGSVHGLRPITSAFISNSGERIAMADMNGLISVFDGSLASQLWTFNAEAIVHSLSMSGNGLVMAASSDNGNVYLFDEEVQKKASGVTSDILFAPIIIAACAFLYLLWRKRAKTHGKTL
jgi:WD40 repeat protein